MQENRTITVVTGDGVGPEIVLATLGILRELPCHLKFEVFATSEAFEKSHHGWAMSDSFHESVARSGIILKGPTKTPQGGGDRSLNVFLRASLGLYANVRPVKSLFPGADPSAPPINLTIVRENSEDLYTGSEYWQSPEQTVALKICTPSASERICRYAFEYARLTASHRITCMTKDNIMKITDGLFHECFRRVASDYGEVNADHQIIDIGAAKLATRPHEYGVIVTNNLYGDIISDIAAQVAGSVGLCGSANIGDTYAMFEAIHGTAPDIAGTGVANPSGLISASILMLAHMGESLSATLLADAWNKTLAAGLLTTDLSHFRNLFENPQILSTQEFAVEVEGRIESGTSSTSTLVMPLPCPKIRVNLEEGRSMRLVGVDVTVVPSGKEDPADRIRKAYSLSTPLLHATTVMHAGTPLSRLSSASRESSAFTIRYESSNLCAVTGLEVCEMIRCLVLSGFEVTATQNLYASDSRRRYFE